MDATVTGLGIARTAINRHFMPALDKSRGKFFRKRFEAAVLGRDAARSQQSYAHAGGMSQGLFSQLTLCGEAFWQFTVSVTPEAMSAHAPSVAVRSAPASDTALATLHAV
jgi:hypothetical protein